MHFRKVLVGAVAYVYRYRRELAKALIVPIGFVVALELVLTGFVISSVEIHQAISILVSAIGYAVFAVVAVIVHRIIILGPEKRDWIPKWTRIETRFLLYIAALFVIALPFFGLMFVPYIGPYLGVLAYVWFISRLSLVFPSTAIGHPLTVGESWQHTRHHQLLMIFSVAIVPIIFGLPLYLIGPLWRHAYLISPFIDALMMVFTVAALSVAYRVVCEDAELPPNNALERPNGN